MVHCKKCITNFQLFNKILNHKHFNSVDEIEFMFVLLWRPLMWKILRKHFYFPGVFLMILLLCASSFGIRPICLRHWNFLMIITSGKSLNFKHPLRFLFFISFLFRSSRLNNSNRCKEKYTFILSRSFPRPWRKWEKILFFVPISRWLGWIKYLRSWANWKL